jgi:glycosyltransferase involved in cell wall biosynthesis
MKISVIMPVYNDEKHVRQAIESFLEQEIEDKELICVDDGSTDKSREVISEFVRKYCNVRLFTQKNSGSGKARNKGLSHAKGKYVCFLDSDDFYIDRLALMKMYQVVEENNLNACAAMSQTYHEDKYIKENLLREILRTYGENIILYRDCQIDFQYTSFVFKRDFLLQNKIVFPNLWRFQDPPFLVQALYYADKFGIVDVELYGYRWGHKRINWTQDRVIDLMKGLLYNIRFAKKHQLQILFDNTLKRINRQYFSVLYRGIESNNKDLLRLLLQADKIAESENETILVLDYLISGKKQYSQSILDDFVFQKKLEDVLQKDRRIVLYGAGAIGMKCYEILKDNEYVEIVLWVDHYKYGQVCYGQMLSDIYDINGVNFDELLIAIGNSELSSQIKDQLLSIGISESKLIEWVERKFR